MYNKVIPRYKSCSKKEEFKYYKCYTYCMKGKTIKIQILELIENSQGIKQKEIADRLPNTTGATVSAYLGKLKYDKLIHTPTYNSYHLLDEGREVLRKYRAKQGIQKPEHSTPTPQIAETVIDTNKKEEKVKKQYHIRIQGEDIVYEELVDDKKQVKMIISAIARISAGEKM